MSKGFAGNFFEHFALGQQIPCPTPRMLGPGEIAQYIAHTGDRTAHFCGGGGRIHPLLLFHQVLSQTVRHLSLNAVANLGYAELVFHRPARSGEIIHTTAEVIGLKENSSGRSGIVWVRTAGRSDQGELLLSFVRWVMVRKRGTDQTQWREDPVIPELASMVAPDQLWLDLGDLPTQSQTGSAWTYGDYQVGERIYHRDGHTVTAGDHMGFTRLFQNSARVHFDALHTDGQPLVFGGYPMSIGYAQMLNGLDNRMGLAAINAGTHALPVHAGDTLYSMTEVLQMDPLGDAPLGAIRCRLLVCKNQDPAGHPDAPSVVLDLDLWELVPKRLDPTAPRTNP
jgi:2-methylfumaryl-CoA hydratase